MAPERARVTRARSTPAASEPIFHLTTLTAWRDAESQGAYRHDSLGSEGFIHCSSREQVRATWERIFSNATGLVVLEIDPRRLESILRYEYGEPEELFPHVYGPIQLEAVTAVTTPDKF